MLTASQPTTSIANINPAWITKQAEIIAYDDKLDCIYDGHRYNYSEYPEHVQAAIVDDLNKNRSAKKHLAIWKKEESIDELRQYTFCTLGGCDNDADIDENGNIIANEYHDCGRRGLCKYEGKVCPSLKVANGYLTKTEVRFIALAHLPNKIIADLMCISEETVNGHVQNTTRKTSLSRAELVRFAAKKGIN